MTTLDPKAPGSKILLTPRQIVRARRRRAAAGYWRMYRRNRQGMVGLVILIFFGLLAIFGPLLVDGAQLQPASATGPVYHAPSLQYVLGTDNFGRPVLGLVITGARVSLLVGFVATIGTMLIGATVGIAAGYYGGTRVDTALNFLINWFLVLPWIPLAIALAAISEQTLHLPPLVIIIFVIAITSWAGTARLVRAQALTVRERTYVERARAQGSGDLALIARHILPNVFPVLFANTVLTVSLSILSETSLSFLGLGDPNALSWGRILEEAFSHAALISGFWWWVIPPGIAIVLVTLSFTMCGYALDEILNPKLRER